jgi:uncharacterized protein YndB with AHSA1/START domain
MAEWRTLEHHGRQMRIEVGIAADARKVWEAWADPARIAQWFVDEAEGEAKTGATVRWTFRDFGVAAPYEVKDAVPGERYALGGQLPGRPPFLLEIRLERGGGETVVTLVNSGFLEGAQWDEEYEGIASGWALALRLLKEYVERHFGEPRNTVLVTRPAEFTYERLRPFYTTADGLRAWLAASATMGAAGEPYAFRLTDGTRMSGRVLWVSKREVALYWTEMDAVAELKAFATGPDRRMLALRVTGWGPQGERVQGLAPGLRASLDRLAEALAG